MPEQAPPSMHGNSAHAAAVPSESELACGNPVGFVPLTPPTGGPLPLSPWPHSNWKPKYEVENLLPFALTACYAITWPPWQLETQEAAGSHKITIQQRANDAKQSHGHGQEPLSQKGLGQQQHVPCIKIVQAMLKTFIPFSPKFGSGGVLPAPAEQWRRNTEKNKYKSLFLLDRKGKLNYKIKCISISANEWLKSWPGLACPCHYDGTIRNGDQFQVNVGMGN
uniref:HDC06741 n=1 Tax=Drosophila melanogaster TaxID=7227 RepID=Q6IGB7_DROME|nr:TPA_inf: HDC06741 [Drosophila melanogaster]